MTQPRRGKLSIIDGFYMQPGYAASYLITDGEEAAFFDTVTRFSVPRLLEELKRQGFAPAQVRYIVASHCHLDHSAGTAELVKHCPNATVICHPRARRHLIDPTKLVAASKPVYGRDVFDRLFGEIEPIDESRVREIVEGETLEFGGRALTCLHTPGHAPHHMSLIDPENGTAFTGDAYGLAYRALQTGRRPYMAYIVSPGDFSPSDARSSIAKIRATGAERACVTHFGVVDRMEAAAELMLRKIDFYERIAGEAAAGDLEGGPLREWCHDRTLEYILEDLGEAGLAAGDPTIRGWAEAELKVTMQGLAVHAGRLRKAAQERAGAKA